MKVLMLNRYDRLGASSRMRSLQFLPWLAGEGIEVSVQPLFNDEQLALRYREGHYRVSLLMNAYGARLRELRRRRGFDLVWVEKEALPWLPAWFERQMLSDVPYVLDYDDAIFHQYDHHRFALVRTLLGQRIDRLMRGSRLVVAGNQYLADRARHAGAPRVEVVPTVIDIDRYPMRSLGAAHDGPLRIVWIGSPSTITYLAGLQASLQELARSHDFMLRVVGVKGFSMDGVKIETLDWSEATEAESLRTCDIGVMPLTDGPWERGKCGYKLIQYMACGLPVVGSPVGVNVDIVHDGENGYLASTDAQWTAALSRLLGDAGLRERMGRAGRQRVEAEYCVQRVAPRLARLLHEVEEAR